IYPDYLLIGGKDHSSGNVWSVEADRADRPLSRDCRDDLRAYMRRNTTVGFNSLPFDLPVIYAAIAGLTVREIKRLADGIIRGGLKPWEVEREWGIEVPRNI